MLLVDEDALCSAIEGNAKDDNKCGSVQFTSNHHHGKRIRIICSYVPHDSDYKRTSACRTRLST